MRIRECEEGFALWMVQVSRTFALYSTACPNGFPKNAYVLSLTFFKCIFENDKLLPS